MHDLILPLSSGRAAINDPKVESNSHYNQRNSHIEKKADHLHNLMSLLSSGAAINDPSIAESNSHYNMRNRHIDEYIGPNCF